MFARFLLSREGYVLSFGVLPKTRQPDIVSTIETYLVAVGYGFSYVLLATSYVLGLCADGGMVYALA